MFLRKPLRKPCTARGCARPDCEHKLGRETQRPMQNSFIKADFFWNLSFEEGRGIGPGCLLVRVYSMRDPPLLC